jgi:hypothetical protein
VVAAAVVSGTSFSADPAFRKKPAWMFRAGFFTAPMSRHIYTLLTIAIALSDSGAFEGLWQRLIKVDGTFA